MIKSEAEMNTAQFADKEALQVSDQIKRLEQEVIFLERAIEDAKSKGLSTAMLSVLADRRRSAIRDLLAGRDLVSHKPKAG